MRVLMTADTIGGVWSHALELARGYGRRGIEVSLATQGALPSRDQRRAAESLPNVALHESEFRLEWMDDPWDDVRRAGEWLLQLEQRVAPDVVHLNDYTHAALQWCAPTLVAGHSCVLSWWRAVKGCDAPARFDRYREHVRAGLGSAHAIATPSAAMARSLEEHYDVVVPIHVIPNGRAAGRVRPAAKGPLVLGAGRVWDEGKNLRMLDAAAHGLPWRVFIAGDTRHPDGIHADTGDAHALGRLSSEVIARWYASASIYALPALYEPFGLSALEAGLSGCALVLGDIPSLREVWGDAALFVPPRSADALRAALLQLIEDENLRVRLSRAATRRALGYSATRMVEQYLQLYRELLATREGAALAAS